MHAHHVLSRSLHSQRRKSYIVCLLTSCHTMTGSSVRSSSRCCCDRKSGSEPSTGGTAFCVTSAVYLKLMPLVLSCQMMYSKNGVTPAMTMYQGTAGSFIARVSGSVRQTDERPTDIAGSLQGHAVCYYSSSSIMRPGILSTPSFLMALIGMTNGRFFHALRC